VAKEMYPNESLKLFKSQACTEHRLLKYKGQLITSGACKNNKKGNGQLRGNQI
jgi:hypothetical protein